MTCALIGTSPKTATYATVKVMHHEKIVSPRMLMSHGRPWYIHAHVNLVLVNFRSIYIEWLCMTILEGSMDTEEKLVIHNKYY